MSNTFKHTVEYFKINGYWKDDKSEFSDYVVKSTHDVLESEDDNIFFYGISEKDIKQAIEQGENTAQDFVITSYTKYDHQIICEVYNG